MRSDVLYYLALSAGDNLVLVTLPIVSKLKSTAKKGRFIILCHTV